MLLACIKSIVIKHTSTPFLLFSFPSNYLRIFCWVLLLACFFFLKMFRRIAIGSSSILERGHRKKIIQVWHQADRPGVPAVEDYTTLGLKFMPTIKPNIVIVILEFIFNNRVVRHDGCVVIPTIHFYQT